MSVATSTELELIRRTALDYFEGWFDGDAERMARALHPELVKRRADNELGAITKEQMVGWTQEGLGRRDTDRAVEVEVSEVYEQIATAIVRSTPFREYLHLVRTDDGWKIANTLYVRT